MFNVCPMCGQYAVEKEIDSAVPAAICPHCGYAHPFLRLPLFVLTGASGAGKTAIALRLVEELRTECVVLDSDILWRPELATPEDGYRSFRDLCLRVAKNIGQAGLPVVLVGTVVPEQLETVPERRYFSAIHYLAAVCDDDELTRRLRARPAWRDSGTETFIERMLRFNQWLKSHYRCTDPPMALLDTTQQTVDQSASESVCWIRNRWFAAPRLD